MSRRSVKRRKLQVDVRLLTRPRGQCGPLEEWLAEHATEHLIKVRKATSVCHAVMTLPEDAEIIDVTVRPSRPL